MKKALILHSGGQDSTTCLVWALSKFAEVETISFDYGQRHRIELECAEKIAKEVGVKNTVIKVGDIFSQMGKNALTDTSVAIAESGHEKNKSLPTTFVPGRNLFFLTIAGSFAYGRGIHDLVTGVCQTDYSGYPDCRDDTVRAMESALRKGMDYDISIHTPLMFLTKADTVRIMRDHGKLDLLKYSHTCYEGARPACGKCPACVLRLRGFAESGEKDPLEYATH
ncbi:MAG: 7-cyano-7-deazaguanine synthase QueC [Patescibacteria group bacterium]